MLDGISLAVRELFEVCQVFPAQLGERAGLCLGKEKERTGGGG